MSATNRFLPSSFLRTAERPSSTSNSVINQSNDSNSNPFYVEEDSNPLKYLTTDLSSDDSDVKPIDPIFINDTVASAFEDAISEIESETPSEQSLDGSHAEFLADAPTRLNEARCVLINETLAAYRAVPNNTAASYVPFPDESDFLLPTQQSQYEIRLPEHLKGAKRKTLSWAGDFNTFPEDERERKVQEEVEKSYAFDSKMQSTGLRHFVLTTTWLARATSFEALAKRVPSSRENDILETAFGGKWQKACQGFSRMAD